MAEFADGKIEAFVGPEELGAPDNLEEVIAEFIAGAKTSLDIAVQELDSEPIAQAILDARYRGVGVRMFMEQDYLLEPRLARLPKPKTGETPQDVERAAQWGTGTSKPGLEENRRTPQGTQGEIPDALADEKDPDGNANPLYSAKDDPRAIQEGRDRGVTIGAETRRSRSSQQSLPLPTPPEIHDLIEIRDFETFSNRLDSIHGSVHMWVGGHMTQIDVAAYDPIFWAHHCMVDRIWRIWQNRHGRAGPPESIWDEALEPFGMTVRRTLSVTRLGYDYAASTDSQRTDD